MLTAVVGVREGDPQSSEDGACGGAVGYVSLMVSAGFNSTFSQEA